MRGIEVPPIGVPGKDCNLKIKRCSDCERPVCQNKIPQRGEIFKTGDVSKEKIERHIMIDFKMPDFSGWNG